MWSVDTYINLGRCVHSHVYTEHRSRGVGRTQPNSAIYTCHACVAVAHRHIAAAHRLRLHALGSWCGGNGRAVPQPRALTLRLSRPSARRLAHHRPRASAQAIARALAVALGGAGAGCQLHSNAASMAEEAPASAGRMRRKRLAAAADGPGRLKAWLSTCWKVSKESTRRPSEEVTSVVEVVELASDTSWSIQPSSEAIDSTRFS